MPIFRPHLIHLILATFLLHNTNTTYRISQPNVGRGQSPGGRCCTTGANEDHRRSGVSHDQTHASCVADLSSRGVQTDLDLDNIGDPETADIIPDLLADYAADCNDWTAIAQEHWKQGRMDRAEELIRKGIECTSRLVLQCCPYMT